VAQDPKPLLATLNKSYN